MSLRIETAVAESECLFRKPGYRTPARRTGPHTTTQHQAAESKEHHGETTKLWNDREGISLAGRGAPGGGALAALCSRFCDHDDRLDLCVRAWLVDLAVLCRPSADVADRRLAAG